MSSDTALLKLSVPALDSIFPSFCRLSESLSVRLPALVLMDSAEPIISGLLKLRLVDAVFRVSA